MPLTPSNSELVTVWQEPGDDGYTSLSMDGLVCYESKEDYDPKDYVMFLNIDALVEDKGLMAWEIEVMFRRVAALKAYMKTKHFNERQPQNIRELLDVQLLILQEYAVMMVQRGGPIVAGIALHG